MDRTKEHAQDLQRAATRLECAFDLFELGLDMLRTRLRREDPTRSEADIQAHVNAWLQTRRGAEHGDAEGPL